MEVYCKKCGNLCGMYDFECTECGSVVGDSKCYMCTMALDHMNKFTSHKFELADGRKVLVCTKCKSVVDDGIKTAKSRGIEIDHSIRGIG